MVLSTIIWDPTAQLGGELLAHYHQLAEKDAAVALQPSDADLLVAGMCL